MKPHKCLITVMYEHTGGTEYYCIVHRCHFSKGAGEGCPAKCTCAPEEEESDES